ncbi:MAG: OmpH family outer membrane protein [Bacteroidota bacterium]|nr:OmpH family outer membrane protein [Bacteroidota bacterium]
MKHFSLILNVILLLLVGYLYFDKFSSSKKSITYIHSSNDSSCNHGNKVAYIDLDSLQSNYEYYKILKTEFERKQNASNNEINAMQKHYQSRAMQLQQKGPTMNPQEQQAAMQEINKMQQDLQAKKQSLDNDLYTYNSKMKQDIVMRIQNFLKDYNKDGRYDYIFSYEPGFMFYKDSTLNITKDVVTGLNELYVRNKK